MSQPSGVYMYLTDPEQLRKWMAYRHLSYGDLGRAADVSRQFIHQLATGRKRTCKPKTARLIEKILLDPPEVRKPGEVPLFVERRSDVPGELSETVRAS
jgi:hypothetical protein